MVNEFEKEFSKYFTDKLNCIAVGSGTDALHLSYILANIKPDDKVIVPVFTWTATNIPLLYLGADIIFADIDKKTMNIDVGHVKQLISEKMKAIVCVHYGGLPWNMKGLMEVAKQYKIPIIQDSAHAIGAKYDGENIANLTDFSCFSFQAI